MNTSFQMTSTETPDAFLERLETVKADHQADAELLIHLPMLGYVILDGESLTAALEQNDEPLKVKVGLSAGTQD
jgi:hypothetical protein